eukprot:167397-Rhodomonas_salina.1
MTKTEDTGTRKRKVLSGEDEEQLRGAADDAEDSTAKTGPKGSQSSTAKANTQPPNSSVLRTYSPISTTNTSQIARVAREQDGTGLAWRDQMGQDERREEITDGGGNSDAEEPKTITVGPPGADCRMSGGETEGASLLALLGGVKRSLLLRGLGTGPAPKVQPRWIACVHHQLKSTQKHLDRLTDQTEDDIFCQIRTWLRNNQDEAFVMGLERKGPGARIKGVSPMELVDSKTVNEFCTE